MTGGSRRRTWAELSPRRRAGVVVLSVVELVLTSVALRDLARRGRGEVRGPRWVWWLVCFVQPVGPVLYLAVGRR